MTLMSQLRERAAIETEERAIKLAQETDAEDEQVTTRCLMAVAVLMASRWGIAPGAAEGLDGVPVAYFDRQALPVEVTVERGDPHPIGGWRPLRRVLVEVDDVTFVCTESRSGDDWEFPDVRLGRFCRFCGTVVAVGGRGIGSPKDAARVLELPMPEHTVMEGGQSHLCDGDRMKPVPEPPARRRDRVVLVGVGEEPVENLAADEWVIEKWLGAVNVAGNPVAVAVVSDGRHLEAEEPF